MANNPALGASSSLLSSLMSASASRENARRGAQGRAEKSVGQTAFETILKKKVEAGDAQGIRDLSQFAPDYGLSDKDMQMLIATAGGDQRIKQQLQQQSDTAIVNNLARQFIGAPIVPESTPTGPASPPSQPIAPEAQFTPPMSPPKRDPVDIIEPQPLDPFTMQPMPQPAGTQTPQYIGELPSGKLATNRQSVATISNAKFDAKTGNWDVSFIDNQTPLEKHITKGLKTGRISQEEADAMSEAAYWADYYGIPVQSVKTGVDSEGQVFVETKIPTRNGIENIVSRAGGSTLPRPREVGQNYLNSKTGEVRVMSKQVGTVIGPEWVQEPSGYQAGRQYASYNPKTKEYAWLSGANLAQMQEKGDRSWIPIQASVDLVREKGTVRQQTGAQAARAQVNYLQFNSDARELIEMSRNLNKDTLLSAIPIIGDSIDLRAADTKIRQHFGSSPEAAYMSKALASAEVLGSIIGGTGQGSDYKIRLAQDLIKVGYDTPALQKVVRAHLHSAWMKADAASKFDPDRQLPDWDIPTDDEEIEPPPGMIIGEDAWKE